MRERNRHSQTVTIAKIDLWTGVEVRAKMTRQCSCEHCCRSVRMIPSDRPTHKYSHGHALILSGPSGRGGAARLAARGALRIGAGVVTVGCPPDALAENAARLDAVMLRRVADADGLAAVLEDQRINALCLGPGMGIGACEAALVAVALRSWAAPTYGAGCGCADACCATSPMRFLRRCTQAAC